MMWQPIWSAWTMLSTSRGLAQISSTLGSGRRIVERLATMIGTGSTPVSAMRPANTETKAAAAALERLGDRNDLRVASAGR